MTITNKWARWPKYIVLGANLIWIVASILSYISPHISPEQGPLFPIFGLLGGVFLIGNLFFIVLWCFWHRSYVLLSACTLIVGFGANRKIFTIPTNFTEAKETDISLASFNLQFFKPYLSDKLLTSHAGLDLQTYIKENMDVDILCVQEYGKTSAFLIDKYLKFPFYYHPENTTAAIFSRYPILASGELGESTNPANVILYIDVLRYGDTIRVYSAHLESNRPFGVVPLAIKEADEEVMDVNTYLGILKYYNVFANDRCEQATLIKKHAAKVKFPTIICGDMNDTPLSRAYDILQEDMTDTWIGNGWGLGGTHDSRIPGIRIDHILVSQEFKVAAYAVIPSDWSDHHLTKTEIFLKDENRGN